MLNAVDYAVRKIHMAIPKEILEKTFINVVPRFKSLRNAYNLDTLIKEHVIRKIVLVDCNLIGANQVDVVLQRSWCEPVSNGDMVVRIPKGFTQNRTIIEVLSCNFIGTPGMMMSSVGPYSPSVQVSNMNKLLNSTMNPTISSTVKCEVVGENVIYINGMMSFPANSFLTVMVEHDDNLSNMRKQAYPVFAELCILACKAYIWSNRIIEMDKSEIEGGYQLNRFSSIVENYEDAFEQYTEFFNEKWRKTAWMADPARQRKHIELITRVGI